MQSSVIGVLPTAAMFNFNHARLAFSPSGDLDGSCTVLTVGLQDDAKAAASFETTYIHPTHTYNCFARCYDSGFVLLLHSERDSDWLQSSTTAQFSGLCAERITKTSYLLILYIEKYRTNRYEVFVIRSAQSLGTAWVTRPSGSDEARPPGLTF